MEPLCVCSWLVAPWSAWVFSSCSGFLPHPKELRVGMRGPVMGVSRPACGPILHPELPGEALITHNPELESSGWKIILLIVIIHVS